MQQSLNPGAVAYSISRLTPPSTPHLSTIPMGRGAAAEKNGAVPMPARSLRQWLSALCFQQSQGLSATGPLPLSGPAHPQLSIKGFCYDLEYASPLATPRPDLGAFPTRAGPGLATCLPIGLQLARVYRDKGDSPEREAL